MIIDISPKIGQLKKLRKLDLSGNGLTSLPKEIVKLKLLDSLYLSFNLFKELPESITELNNLNNLHLAYNNLTALPMNFSNLKTLKELHLDWNNFRVFPEALYDMNNLQYLQLNDNKLEVLPTQIKTLNNLIRLDLNTNNLISLPPEIGYLSNVVSLHISSNKLQELPFEIADLPNLKYLEIDDNPFLNMRDITKLGLGRLIHYLNQKRAAIKPPVFIGSSTEGEKYSKAIERHLLEKTKPQNWRGVFQLSSSTMESLIEALDKFEYAIFVLTPDDTIRSRKKEFLTARDNLFFEMGLFISRIGMKRVFFMIPKSLKKKKVFKLPSDLNSITHDFFEDAQVDWVDKDYDAATLEFSTKVLELIDEDQKFDRLKQYSIEKSVLKGKWEAIYSTGNEHFTIDDQGRYIIDGKVYYVVFIIRETNKYVEFVRIPVQGDGDLNTSRFEKVDRNHLRGIESNNTTTTYRRRYL